MPRVSANLEKSVFYLFPLDAKTGKISAGPPGATGFFVATEVGRHTYAVSNRHAINPNSCIRINTETGTRPLEYTADDWTCSPNADVAIPDVTDDINESTDDYSWIYHSDFLTPDKIWGFQVGIGDQVLMMGLFADHDGGERNVPVGRFGNVAAMPHEDRPVYLIKRDAYSRPSYLMDMRSRGGFSGSPVWIWRTPLDDLSYYDAHGAKTLRRDPFDKAFLCFAGVHRGQFPEKTVALDPTTKRALSTMEIPSAMTVVVPAWEITALLEHPKIKAQRDARDQRPERIAAQAAMERLSRAEEER